MANDLPDVPAVPLTLERGTRELLLSLRQHVRELRGFQGNPGAKAVTVGTAGTIGGGGGVIVVPGNPGGGSVEPDLTPPPSPSGVTVTAGLSFLFYQTAEPLFGAGHGYGRTKVYGAKWPTSAPVAPTFSDAVLIDEFVGVVGSTPTDLGSRWCVWLKWVSNDGVASTDPAGGTNGFQATTGKVGSSDLAAASVLAQALAPGSVTADKAALDIGGNNLAANNSFELDSNGDGTADNWGLYDGTGGGSLSRVAGRISGMAQRYTTTTAADTWARGISGGSIVWQPNKTYVVSFYARAIAGSGFQGKVVALEWNQHPALTVGVKNPPLSPLWQRYAFRINFGPSAEPTASLYVSSGYQGMPTGSWDIDDLQVEEGDTLTAYAGKLALNTIVAGDGAIANLAITNALVANAAIDDAKVVNMSVAKLLAGSLSVGQHITSQSYVPGTSGWIIRADGTAEFAAASIRGKLVANQIDGRNLEIKDGSGNVILSAGQTLSWGYVQAASRPRVLVAASKGYQNNTSPLGSGAYLDGVYQRGPYWWGLCWYDPSTLALLDYYEFGPGTGSADTAADKLEYYLNNGGNQILSVTTDDHPTGMYNARFIAALLRYGASRGGLGSTSFLTTFRAAYALIGRVGLGEGQGIENLSRVTSSYAIASATIMNGQIVGGQKDFKIDPGNVSTFIDNAAINAAQIGSLNVGLLSTAWNGGAPGAHIELALNKQTFFRGNGTKSIEMAA